MCTSSKLPDISTPENSSDSSNEKKFEILKFSESTDSSNSETENELELVTSKSSECTDSSNSETEKDMEFITSESSECTVSSDCETQNEQELELRRKRMRILSESESENDTNIAKLSQNSDAFRSTEKGDDGTTWTKLDVDKFSAQYRFHRRRFIAGPTDYAKQNVRKGKVSSAFHLIITNNMIKHIKSCTEEEATGVLNREWKISTNKLLAFIGILYARGAYKVKSLKASYLWSEEWRPPFFSNTMLHDEFMEILRFLRFDKKTKRSERLSTDKFAMISEIWDKFTYNSQCCYKPHENISVGEQLFSTKARCKFTKCMPNQPQKFAIKFWFAVDAQSKYILNGFPYLGKNDKQASTPLAEFVVFKLTALYLDQGRNITTANSFTSIPLAKKLLLKKTSLVGTIPATRIELPKKVKTNQDKMKVYSSVHYKSGKCILTVYKSKPNVKDILLSTKHTAVTVKDNKTHTPETISYYNETKLGVHTVNQMARRYTTKAPSFRWPLQVFFNILDLAAINAWILYTECTQLKLSRKKFLLQLAKELVQSEISFENISKT